MKTALVALLFNLAMAGGNMILITETMLAKHDSLLLLGLTVVTLVDLAEWEKQHE